MLKFVNKNLKRVLIIMIIFGYTISYAGTNRHLYVISDLHMGVGKIDSTRAWKDREWDNLEDFRWHDEFDKFIDDIINESKNNADLVIAGDFLELWQGRDNLCNYPENKDIGCSEKEALVRVKRVVFQHKQVFASLKKFISIKGNKLIIIPGNHDVALLFSKVAEHILDQFGTKKKSVSISSTGWWLNEDKKIIVDHGHQVKYDINRFKKWPEPFIDYKGTRYLRKTAGEQLVQKLFNDMEDDIPLIDNISSEFEGFQLAIEAGRWDALGAALSSGIDFLFNHMSWSQGGILLDGNIPNDINVSAVKINEGKTFFYNSFEKDSKLYRKIKKLVDDKSITVSIDDLSDDTIKKICIKRLVLHTKQKNNNQTITINPCNSSYGDSLGAMGHKLAWWVSDEETMSRYIMKLELALHKQKIIGKKRSTKYIYGHTHKYQDKKTYKIEDKNWEIDVLNTGAWQRVVKVDKLKEIAKRKKVSDIFSLTLDDIPACYTYVSAKGYKDPHNMEVKLIKWGKGCSSWE